MGVCVFSIYIPPFLKLQNQKIYKKMEIKHSTHSSEDDSQTLSQQKSVLHGGGGGGGRQ